MLVRFKPKLQYRMGSGVYSDPIPEDTSEFLQELTAEINNVQMQTIRAKRIESLPNDGTES